MTGTNGLVTEMDTYAIPYPYTIGGLTINDFYAQSRAQEALGVTASDIFHFDGTDLEFQWQQLLSTYFAQAQADGLFNAHTASRFFNSDSTGMDGESLSATIDFTTIKVAQKYHTFNNPKLLTMPQMLGLPDYNAGYWGMSFPMSKHRAQLDLGSKDTSLPSIGMTYRSMNGYNRMVELTINGGANGVSTNHEDRKSWQWISEIGAEHVNLFQAVFMQLA
jgi:hypothetical protein